MRRGIKVGAGGAVPLPRLQDVRGSAVTFPSGVRGEAPAAFDFFNITKPIVTADEVKTISQKFASQKFAKPTATKQVRSN